MDKTTTIEKIKSFFVDLFSWKNFSAGLFGLGISILIGFIFESVMNDPFGILHIFINCIWVFVVVILLGYIMNKTIYKKDL